MPSISIHQRKLLRLLSTLSRASVLMISSPLAEIRRPVGGRGLSSFFFGAALSLAYSTLQSNGLGGLSKGRSISIGGNHLQPKCQNKGLAREGTSCMWPVWSISWWLHLMQRSMQMEGGGATQHSLTRTTRAHSNKVVSHPNASKPIALAARESGFASSAMLCPL